MSINNSNTNNSTTTTSSGLPPSGSLARAKSEQLVEKVTAAFKSPPAAAAAAAGEAAAGEGGGGGAPLSRKSSRQLLSAASPGRSNNNNNNNNNNIKNTHIRKSRSAQLKFDLDELTSGAALSRASSASLGLSFSFTGFTVPPEDIADSKPFSDDDIPEDIEAGMRKPKLQTEPTLPIYLKAKKRKEIHSNQLLGTIEHG